MVSSDDSLSSDDALIEEVHFSVLQGVVLDTPVLIEDNHSFVSDISMTSNPQDVSGQAGDKVTHVEEPSPNNNDELASESCGTRKSKPALKIALGNPESPAALNHPVTPIYEDSDSVGFPSPLSSPNTSRNSHTDSPGRASSRLASPVGFYTRSRSSTNDSRASGSIDGRSYFNGPEDKLVSRLVSRFSESGDSQTEQTIAPKTRNRKKKVDHSFLKEDNTTATRTLNRKKSRPSSLRVSSKENVKKHWQSVEGSDSAPPMPDSAPGGLSFWNSESTEDTDDPLSPRSVNKPHFRFSNRDDSDMELNGQLTPDLTKHGIRNSFDFGKDETTPKVYGKRGEQDSSDELKSPNSIKSENNLERKRDSINEGRSEMFDFEGQQKNRKEKAEEQEELRAEISEEPRAETSKELRAEISKELRTETSEELQAETSDELQAETSDELQAEYLMTESDKIRAEKSTEIQALESAVESEEKSAELRHEQSTENESVILPKIDIDDPTTAPVTIEHDVTNDEPVTSNVAELAKSFAETSLVEEAIKTDTSVTDDSSQINDPDNLIFGVCVVGFHHAKGPEVEYWVGPDGDMSNTWPYLAFQCLPDGSHTHEENFCYFTLLFDEEKKIAPNPTPQRDGEGHIIEESNFISVTTLFGISCNRQLKTDDLKNKTADMTRSTVQKSVVVIAKKPIFGAIKDKLAVVTRAYFEQGDFTDVSLVETFYQNLRMMFSRRLSESDLTVGMPLRELIHRLGKNVLVILKALLLERRVLVFASNTELLCASQFSIISLIPGLINHLEDSGSPLLSSYETTLVKANSLKTSDRLSLLRYMGLPLQIFAAGGLFSPYVPLQQIDELKADEAKYFLVGTTNTLLMEPSSVSTDVVVDMDAGTITIHDDDSLALNISNKKLNTLLSLSSMDKRWMDFLVKAVSDTWDPEDPLRPKDNGFYGTEDYIRMQFEDYIMHMLASVKYDNFLKNGGQLPLVHRRENIIKQYNADWVAAWKNTNNYRIFDKFTDNEIFDVTQPIHMASVSESEMVEAGPVKSKSKVSRVFGGLWKASSSRESVTEKQPSQQENVTEKQPSQQENVTEKQENLQDSDTPETISPTASVGDSSVLSPATKHQSELSVSTMSSNGSTDKPPSRASSYLSSWSPWASSKRKQTANDKTVSTDTVSNDTVSNDTVSNDSPLSNGI